MTDVVTYAKDLAERAGWTFVQAAASTFTVEQVANFTELKSAAVASGVAGGAAVLSLVKGVIAGTRTGTASTLKRQAESAGLDAASAALADAERIFPMDVKVDYSKNPNDA